MNELDRARIERALDAVVDGDREFAAELLRDVLASQRTVLPVHRCNDCGRRFRFPGERDTHLERCPGAWRRAA